MNTNPLANWLWKDLYVWPQAPLTPSAYLGALFRMSIIYVIFSHLLTALSPVISEALHLSAEPDFVTTLVWGEIGAIVLIAFPVWSAFQRRVNDMRPDIREKLKPWSVAFPLIFTGLIGVMIANSLGYKTPFEFADLSRFRFWFLVMLFGSAFVPGGDVAPVKIPAKTPPQTFQTAAQKAAREALAAQVAAKPMGRQISVPRADRPKPAPAANFPRVMERTRKLPQDGRVKPGWFA